ncbi:MAG TPA: insulinase family protein [Prolixibacteraceae bacterium]|nr:insulinase family protein [Prolixibacteraceae bacterium]
MKHLKIATLFICVLFAQQLFSSNFEIETYKLDNGLTVILNHDKSQNQVFGAVAVKAGSVNDPEEATGLAHYLEHLMFNGTHNVGTIDWESEKVHYQKVIDLFEELHNNTDPKLREPIIKQINEASKEQGKYFQTKELVLLLENIGATNINAGTSYDMTTFHSSFPKSQSALWLEIYANQFVNPVFRNFQAELETVYEEYNMYAEDPNNNFLEKALEKMWEGSPYGKKIIGFSDHLKNPSIKKLIEFYESWYVPENMALILVGDFNQQSIKNEINATFGKWEAKPLAKKLEIEKVKLNKKEKLRLKETPYTIGMWNYNAPYLDDSDLIKVELLAEILSNTASIGVLDQLETDGDVMSIGAFYSPLLYASILAIQAIPNFDLAQMRQLSTSEIDKLIFNKIEEVKKGKIDQKLLDAVRDNFIRNNAVMLENYGYRGSWLLNFFIAGREISDANKYFEQLEQISLADIVEVANKYLNNVYLEVTSSQGEIKLASIEKPKIDPILQTVEDAGEFAKQLYPKIAKIAPEAKYVDFGKDLVRTDIADKVKLYYKQNTQNNIFDLSINYEVGTHHIPTLNFAAQLMNNAGVRGNYKPHEFKQKMGELGCSYNFSADDNELSVSISGREKNLEEACRLISMVTLMPDLDIKQYNSLIGREMNSRQIQSTNFDNISQAGQLYLIYGENSPFIERLTWNQLSELNINKLTGDFIKATKYEATVHYFGSDDFETSKQRILSSLVFAEGRTEAPEYFERDIQKPTENVIYHVNKSNSLQSNIYVMVPSIEACNVSHRAGISLFNNYFGSGLTNIFFSEIREYRSMAYTANAYIISSSITNKPAFLSGYVGTQADKTNDATELIIKLLSEMPLKASKAQSARNNMVYGAPLRRPSDRYLTYTVENWERFGYTKDPSEINAEKFANADLETINSFYKENIQNKPISIMIVGDRKKIDTKALAKIAKYTSVRDSKLFSE